MRPDYKWDFPLSKHESKDQHTQRRKAALERVAKAKEARHTNDRQYHKKAREQAVKMANMRSSLGFLGADLLGVDDDGQSQGIAFGKGTGQHTKPASYVISQQ